jgi:hypothetical protein
LSVLAVRLKQVLQPVKPLANRLMGLIDERFDLAVREASMGQECTEDTPLGRRILSGKRPARVLSLPCGRTFLITNYILLGRFLQSKVGTLYEPKIE